MFPRLLQSAAWQGCDERGNCEIHIREPRGGSVAMAVAVAVAVAMVEAAGEQGGSWPWPDP